jgi:hypothetical protein
VKPIVAQAGSGFASLAFDLPEDHRAPEIRAIEPVQRELMAVFSIVWHVSTAIPFETIIENAGSGLLCNGVQIHAMPVARKLESAFGSDVDYAMLVKMYGNDSELGTRYSPPEYVGTQMAVVSGHPNPQHISTSFVERHNWSVRTAMRRYTRLSNGFSRKIENHAGGCGVELLRL